MSEKITKSQLQRALDGLVSATIKAKKHREIIHNYSIQQFGVDPADIDNDFFIDSCEQSGTLITADQFIESMKVSLAD